VFRRSGGHGWKIYAGFLRMSRINHSLQIWLGGGWDEGQRKKCCRAGLLGMTAFFENDAMPYCLDRIYAAQHSSFRY
jgi:hypothetical protein